MINAKSFSVSRSLRFSKELAPLDRRKFVFAFLFASIKPQKHEVVLAFQDANWYINLSQIILWFRITLPFRSLLRFL